MAAPVPESRACACSKHCRRDGCLRASAAALPPPERMRRRWSRVSLCLCERGSPGHDGQASRYRLRWIAPRLSALAAGQEIVQAANRQVEMFQLDHCRLA